ncbi:MAG: bifunctional riboflavin kinase/FAD synthetase [Limnobacter sp.]|nr:bifunctional riboflavin kinase/FAD synthetase [Limnobacter sp.]
MQVIRRPSRYAVDASPENRLSSRAGTALTIGNFDGVHKGHAALLRHVANTAKTKSLVPTVVTFDPHPKELFNPDFKLNRISTLRDRVTEMKNCGIQQVCVLPFDRAMASLSPVEFIDEVLLGQLNARHIWVGDDFRFGAKRAGDFQFLHSQAAQKGFEVHHIQEIQTAGQRVSSSNIRQALIEGNVARAVELLGHPLVYSGHVLHGKKLGRTLGFPTMNQAFKGRASALSGILAVWVHGLEAAPLPAVASMGIRPTVEESDQILLETYIPDWKGDAYGKLISVEVVAHIRPEQRFDDLDLMVEQMHKDTEKALQALKLNPPCLDTPPTHSI